MSSKKDSEHKFVENFKRKVVRKLIYKWIIKKKIKDIAEDGKWFGDGIYKKFPLIDLKELYGTEYDIIDHIFAYNYNTGDDRCKYYMKKVNKTSNEKDYIPTFKKCVKYGEIPIAILDIVSIYKGVVMKAIIIKSDNEKYNKILRNELKKRFADTRTEIYELDPNKILNLTKIPNKIFDFCEQII